MPARSATRLTVVPEKPYSASVTRAASVSSARRIFSMDARALGRRSAVAMVAFGGMTSLPGNVPAFWLTDQFRAS